MQIEMVRAGKGDCLLLHGGTEDEPVLVLIDGGPGGTWKKDLRPRLEQIRAARGLEDDQPLVVDLVIVSHVDDDHINGVIDLFRVILDAKRAGDPPPFKVKALWHNSFDDLLATDEVRGAQGQTIAASIAPVVPETGDQTEWDAAMLLAGIAQGQELRDLAAALDIEINEDFGGGLIQTPAEGRLVHELGGISFTLVSPRADELLTLQRDHDRWVQDRRARGKPITAPDLLSSLTDKSVANLSSIVLLAEGGGRSILLTGDARADHILMGLERTGLLAADGTLDVEIMKMPHHGSDRNVDEPFLRRIRGRTYLFSGDGKHGNPERATLEMLFAERPEAGYRLLFTYPAEVMDRARKHEHEGSPWSDADHGLVARLAALPAGVTVEAAADHSLVVAAA